MIRKSLQRLTTESLVYGLGQAASRSLQMLLVPVLTRVFAPAEYGVVDLVALVTTIASYLVVLGTDGALARFFYDAEDAAARRTMVSSSILWRTSAGFGAGILLWIGAPWLSQVILGSPDYTKYLRIAAATLPWTGFFLFQNDVLRVTFQPWKFIALNTLNTTVLGGLSVLFVVVWHRSVSGVLYARLIADLITAAAGFVLIRHMLVRRWDPVLLRRLLRFGLPILPAALAYWVIGYADRWVLAQRADLTAVGVYAVAAKLGILMWFVISAFQLAWGPFAFAHARQPEAGRLFARVLTLYMATAAGLALALGLGAFELLAVLVPPDYRAAAVPGGLLAFAAVAHGAYYVVALGVNLALRTDVLAWTSLAAAVITVGLDLALVGPFGLHGVAVATLVGFAAATVFVYVWAQRLHPIPFRGMRALALFAAALVAWGVGTSGAVAVGPTSMAGVAWRAAAFVAYGVLAVWVARRLPHVDAEAPPPGPEPALPPAVAAELP